VAEYLTLLWIVVPVLVLLTLLILAIRRQRRRIGDIPPFFGDGPDDWVREPRRPLVPAGSASAEEPIPHEPEVATDAIGSTASRPSEGPDSLAV
jgi:hypothetical protein